MSKRFGAVLAALLVCMPSLAGAQSTGAIAGTVQDSTSGILPGVTVEVSSEALIERVRAATTDGSGQYRVTNLPPGLYAVTFALPGFSTARREGIELTSGFTATVNVNMTVGSLEETLTVAGSAPVVDIQNSSRQVVMTRDVVDALPTGRVLVEIATLIPGVQMVNGGAGGTGMGGSAGSDQFATLTAHGARSDDTQLEVNGMSVNIFGIRQDSSYMNFQDGNIQEYAVQVSAHSAESESGGVRVNMIPKEGGNRFSGSFFTHFANGSMQADNIDDALRNAGLGAPDKTKRLLTVNPSVGGPLIRDRLWFYGGYSRMEIQRFKAGTYINLTPAAFEPTFDLNQQVIAGEHTNDTNIRLTYQLNNQHKLAAYYDHNVLCQCPYLVGATYIGNNTLDGSNDSPRTTDLFQTNWTWVMSNQLLFEASASLPWFRTDKIPFEFSTEPRITEQTTGLGSRYASVTFDEQNYNRVVKVSMSHVTGRYSTKVGVIGQFANADRQDDPNDQLRITTRNYAPIQAQYRTVPEFSEYRDQVAIFLQNQTTLQRLTLNLGIRYDYAKYGYPDFTLAPSTYVPFERSFPGRQTTGWHDFNPRLGLAYDLFGTGRTAVKASLSRYVITEGTFGSHPAQQNATMNRNWLDPNGDRIIQGDPLNPAANGELGPSTNLNFGVPVVTTNFDEDYAFGWNKRAYNWETALSIQQELAPGVSATFAYHRRWYGNFQITDNLLVGPGDYDPFCVTVPVDPRLPENSGQQICGLYDLKPEFRGISNNIITSSANYGDQIENWQGVDLTMQARLPGGALLNGGFSTGRTLKDSCDVVDKVDNPSLYNCKITEPYRGNYKLGASYTLPYAIEVAGTFQSFAGPGIQGLANFTNADVLPSLGRALTSGNTVAVSLLPGDSGTRPVVTKYVGERTSQVDLRFGRRFTVAGFRIRGMLDLYNAFNINTVSLHNNTYGQTWLRPQGIVSGRLVKVGAQIDF